MPTGDPPIPGRKPLWLKRPLPKGSLFARTRSALKKSGVKTVCQEARCPNTWECFSRGTATFLLLGSLCTRKCTFCAVPFGKGKEPDEKEAIGVATAVDKLSLAYVVLTSVTRDDLSDGGAGFFARVVDLVRQHSPQTVVETLIPDFQGDRLSLAALLKARPDVVSHNLETVARLYGAVRPGSSYARSLELLRTARELDPSLKTKSGIMLGLGETEDEIHQCLVDIRKSGCDALTIGQYLPPSPNHYAVERYVAPQEFHQWRVVGEGLGFRQVRSGPLVRSSYRPEEFETGRCSPCADPVNEEPCEERQC